MSQFNNIQVEVSELIATLTVCREQALNALNVETLQEISVALDAISEDSSVRAVLITGAGDRAFVAGADIKELQHLSVSEASGLAQTGHIAVMDKIANFRKPVLAAVNGFALGGGLELAMACHIRVASTNAKMGLPEVSLGIIPGYGGTQRLPQLVGKGKALEMIMTGDMLTAAEALQWGLVNHVTELSELIVFSRTLLQKTIVRSGTAISLAIKAVNVGLEDAKKGFEQEIKLFGESFGTEDSKEGMLAFIEKRKPKF